MPKVMPVAIRDETGAFIRQMAQGNEALAQLYTRLLAQYEERRMNEAHQKEMMSMREGITQDRIGAQNDEWYRRQEFAHNLRNPQQQQGPNYLGPGAAGTPNPMAPGATPPPATPTSAAPTARPSVYTIDNNPFRSGAGASAPATPAPQKTSMSGEAADAYAQAPKLTEEFSAQSRNRPPPTVSEPPRTPRKEPPPASQLPTQPRAPTARTAATRPQAGYLDIDQKWLDLMHTEEDKHGLPRGTMMTAYGIENGGGRQFGKNKRGSAEGIYQFSKELRDEHKLTDQDIYNPAKMIPAAAANMRRNADILKHNYKIDLPNTPETIPMWIGLHQWGSGAGPRLVASYIQNPDAPMTAVMGTHKDAQGNVIPNHTVLSINGVDPTWSVKQALQNKALPWYRTYAQEFKDHAVQPVGQYKSTPAPPPQQTQQPGAERQQAAPGTSGTSGSGPRVEIPEHGMGTSRRLIAAVRGGAELALPDGYTIIQTSGARPHGRSGSHHHRGNAGDFQIITPDGRYIANKGPDHTGLYTRLARGVKTWVRENDPEAEKYIGHGGAFETRRGSGLEDIMHFDWGGSRGRLRPDMQFAKLKPLEPHERNAPTQVAQKPVKVAGATPTPDTTTPRVAPERAIMPAISRIPTSDEVAATYDNKIANAGFDGQQRTPKVATAPAAPQATPQGIKPSASGVTARSDLDYGLDEEGRFQRGIRDTDWYKEYVTKYNEQPNLDDPNYNYRQAWKSGAQNNLVRDPTDNNMLHWPSEFKGPDHPNRFVGGVDTITGQPNAAGRITPPDTAALNARSDLAYNATPASTPADAQIPGDMYGSYAELPMPPIRPPIEQEITQADRSPTSADSVQDAMADAFRQRTEPNYTQEAFNVQKPPADMPPQLEAGVIPKQPLPDEFTPATPGTPEQQLAIDVPSITPRAALPPGFKVPPPGLDGGMTAAANAPSNVMPRGGTQLPPNLPRQLEPEVVSGNAPTMRSVLDAIYKGQLPNMSTADPNAPPRPPRDEATGAPYNEYVQGRDSKAAMEQVGEWLKENFGRAGADKNMSDRQKLFEQAMQQYVQGGIGAVKDWWNKPSAAVPPKMHPDARMPQQSVAPPPRPIPTMPDGRPYIPKGEPLIVPPRPGSGPTNTTLSGGPQQGAAPLPALPGAVNPATGRVDVPKPVVQPDGTILYTEPGEVVQEQQ